MTGILIVSAFMILTGVVFLWLLLRNVDGYWPKGGIEWAGCVMAVLLILSSGSLMALALFTTEQETIAQSGIGEVAGDFEFKLLADDTAQQLSDYRGKVVLLNFWATWCQPCITELPELDRIHNDYADEGVVVITISDETRELLDIFQDLWPSHTVSGYIAPEDLPEPYQTELLSGRPISYVVDREGMIKEYVVGAGDYDMFERYIRDYI